MNASAITVVLKSRRRMVRDAVCAYIAARPEFAIGINYPLPPQRNDGYLIKTTGGATFTAR